MFVAVQKVCHNLLVYFHFAFTTRKNSKPELTRKPEVEEEIKGRLRPNPPLAVMAT